MTNYARVPLPYMVAGVQRYVENGILPGIFLVALFSNDLEDSFRAADDFNSAAMRDWVVFMVTEMPELSHGSSVRVRNWVEAGGLYGRHNERRPVQP